MSYCEYRHEPEYGKCGLSDKYGECMRCENIESDVCERMRKMAREEEGGGEMTDTEVIEYLMDSELPQIVKERSVNAIRGKNDVVARLEKETVIGAGCVGNGFECIPKFKAISIVRGKE